MAFTLGRNKWFTWQSSVPILCPLKQGQNGIRKKKRPEHKPDDSNPLENTSIVGSFAKTVETLNSHHAWYSNRAVKNTRSDYSCMHTKLSQWKSSIETINILQGVIFDNAYVTEFWEMDSNHTFIFDYMSHHHMNSNMPLWILCGLQNRNYL